MRLSMGQHDNNTTVPRLTSKLEGPATHAVERVRVDLTRYLVPDGVELLITGLSQAVGIEPLEEEHKHVNVH